MEDEIWKNIEGYEGLYQVSNIGRVKSLARNGCGAKDKLVVIQENNCGYDTVLLSKTNIRKRHLVHRLVAIAFVENPEHKPHVNHINGIKKINGYSNLEWVTRSENVIHAMKNGLKQDYGIGKARSAEHRANLSESLKGRKSPCGNAGKKRSAEAIEKFKKSMLNRKYAKQN